MGRRVLEEGPNVDVLVLLTWFARAERLRCVCFPALPCSTAEERPSSQRPAENHSEEEAILACAGQAFPGSCHACEQEHRG